MRLEDQFGRAKMKPSQTIAQYIGEIKPFANHLREVGVEITGSRLAYKILGGLRYESILEPKGGKRKSTHNRRCGSTTACCWE